MLDPNRNVLARSGRRLAAMNSTTIEADVLEPDGVLFGATVLGLSERHTLPARAVLRAFNPKGDFDNREDTAEGLREILEGSFTSVEVDVVGSTAHFSATGRRRRPGS